MIATFNLPTSIMRFIVPETLHLSNHKIASRRLRLRVNYRSEASRDNGDGPSLGNTIKVIYRIVDAIGSHFFNVAFNGIEYFREVIRIASFCICHHCCHDLPAIAVES